MSNLKLFGSTRKARHAALAAKPKRKIWQKLLLVLVIIGLMLEGVYYTAIYSDSAWISKWRDVYIQTAMTTMTHQWLATFFIPSDAVDASVAKIQETLESQIGLESSWDTEETAQESETASAEPEETEAVSEEPEETTEVAEPEVSEEAEPEESVDPEQLAREEFFTSFWEVDEDSFDAYLTSHPEALADGWDNIYINEAGLDDSGTDITTIYGDQILAIDVPNGILLIRFSEASSNGILAVCKDASQVRIGASTGIGSYGQYAGEIAEQENAVLAINSSLFYDPDGTGNGGTVVGYSVYQGNRLGDHMGWGYKRLELREDNLMYIVDAQTTPGDDVTDAVEFAPALIVDGEVIVDENCGYTGQHPRSCIGQAANHDIMMLIVEGRGAGGSLGVSVVNCANFLAKYGCMQAINQDGGSSAIMWYRGEYITHCSNKNTAGRQLPNAWVYGYSD